MSLKGREKVDIILVDCFQRSMKKRHGFKSSSMFGQYRKDMKRELLEKV